MSAASPLQGVKNTIAYLAYAWAVVIVSLLSYGLLRPWLIENTANHYAIYAIWLATTLAVVYVLSKRF